MADISTEKLQNMNIQDFDGGEFDPFAPQNKMANMNKGEQPVDLLGECLENGQMTNGSDKHVSFDQEAGIGLPDPSYINQGQGQGQISGSQGQKDEGLQRHMSEGEILGYQNEYGESIHTGQVEYTGDSEEEECNNLIDIQSTDVDSYPQKGQGYTGGGHVGEYSSPDPSQNLYDEYVENDYVDDNDEGVQNEEKRYDGPVDYVDDNIDPDSWHPQMDPERLRRSKSPERSVSPYVKSESGGDVDSDMISSPSEMAQPESVSEPVGGDSYRESSIPVSEGVETPDLISQGSQQLSSEETESLDSRSEVSEGTPRRRRIPKPKTKKPLELPPWDDNVVVPKLPRMKPTLIGKQADLPPPSPPRFHRQRTAPARHNAKDASSDSGVEEEAKSPRKSSGDVKKKYGTDTKNERYKPGGGNIQVFSQKVDTRSVTPRTDTTKPRSALSPRISPSKEKAPLTPKAPTPNTKQVQSKIGSLNNVKHSPGGGNVKVLNTKVDFSNVPSKVGSKDKIDHKPKGGDKKIETQKLSWQTESKVGSLKNVTHSPGGGNLKVLNQRVSWSAKSRVGSLENATHSPGGGKVKILDQKVEIKAQSKIGSTANIKHKPGGGDKKIETQKLEFKETARPKVGSMDKVKHKPGGGDIKIHSEKLKWETSSKVKSLENAEHVPGGGSVKIIQHAKIHWHTKSKVQSMQNVHYQPSGGNIHILDEKVDFSNTAKPKVGSMDKVKHQPGGGDKKVSRLACGSVLAKTWFIYMLFF
ncbi:microtubule-associated protein tau-like isoform X3 [Mercenaria mercenaria]|uniref:microtubule-associated protein tau-like isoform X3 n=1 Tax=Mercenaria mercenaria TaxID=6596 RepID=UPI00234EE645|nr:microtubule-associated protein tau-like isoform X3 [Mercenaria mercenaria]